MTNDEIDALVEWLRTVAPPRKDGVFAFNMDRFSLIDLNVKINEAATALETLRAERDEAVELLDTASDLLWEHCEGLAPRIEPIDAFLTRIEGKDT